MNMDKEKAVNEITVAVIVLEALERAMKNDDQAKATEELLKARRHLLGLIILIEKEMGRKIDQLLQALDRAAQAAEARKTI